MLADAINTLQPIRQPLSQVRRVRIPTAIIVRVESEVRRSEKIRRAGAHCFNSYIVAAIAAELAHVDRNRSKRKTSRVKSLQAEVDRLRKIIEQLTKETAA